jgi:hypothetical protein
MTLNFLNKQHETKMETATFVPTGMIGALHAIMTFSFYATATPEIVLAYEQKLAFWRPQGNNGFRYYYASKTDADVVAKALSSDIIVNQTFCLRMPLSSIMNITDENKAKFKSDPVVWDMDVTTLRSKQGRHKFQFLFLPQIISAYAQVQGIKHTPFVIPEELSNPDAILSEDIEKKLIGTPDDYTTGSLWQQRKTIWGELGEQDATKYNPISLNPDGTPNEANATKNDTTSSVLSDLLGIVAWEWSSAIYATVLSVTDPKTPKAGKERYGVPLVVKIFASEAEAKAAADAELAAKEGTAPVAPTAPKAVAPVAVQAAATVVAATAPAATDGKYPAMPATWEGITVKDFINEWQKLGDKPVALLMKKLELTQAEYDAWQPVIAVEPPF